jgi:hypothetical protein
MTATEEHEFKRMRLTLTAWRMVRVSGQHGGVQMTEERCPRYDRVFEDAPGECFQAMDRAMRYAEEQQKAYDTPDDRLFFGVESEDLDHD